jgi:hypothetical protein
MRATFRRRLARLEQRCGPMVLHYDSAVRERVRTKVTAFLARHAATHDTKALPAIDGETKRARLQALRASITARAQQARPSL